MSLTGSLRNENAATAAALRDAAQRHFAPLLAAPPERFDCISLFAEPAPGGDVACIAHAEPGR